MKKLFISCPMKGRTEENIKKSMEAMHKIAELAFGEELEVIDSYIKDNPPKDNNQAIWFLGESIKKMSEADCFIGISGYLKNFGGCDVESSVAWNYDIPRFFLRPDDCSFFDDFTKTRFEEKQPTIACSDGVCEIAFED